MQNRRHALESSVVSEQSKVWWAHEPEGRLLLFVHGFGGTATATWRSFPRMLLDDVDFAGWDLLFYGYDSRRSRAEASALVLFNFLNEVAFAPAAFANRIVDPAYHRDPGAFRYRDICIVAHSLGAPVVRKALIEAWRRRPGWLADARCTLYLYAPATAGARAETVARLAGTSGFWLATLLFSYFKYRWPVMDDLVIESPFLTDLLRETRSAAQEGFDDALRARLVQFGEHENIVEYPSNFPGEKPIEVVPGCDHFDICKPNCDRPLAFVRLWRAIKERNAP